MNLFKNLQLFRPFQSKFSIHGRSLLSSFSLPDRKSDTITNQGRQQTLWLSTIVDSSDFECDTLVDDGKVKKKDSQLQVALTQLANEFGIDSKECNLSKLSLSNFLTPRCASVISTGSLKLDLALSIGGLPKGRMVEIFGKEASGKTTLGLHIIKEAQKLGGYCAYLDAENAMDPMLAEAMGVNTENLLLSYPDSAENMLKVVDTLTQSGSVDVIVVDSVAALVPQSEIDGDIGTARGDALSKIMTQALRRVHYSLCRSKTLIIFLNQVRYHAKSYKDLGPRGEVTCGGNALGFYSAVRLRISRTGLLKKNDEPVGVRICVQVVKNKLAPSTKSAQLAIKFGKGLCVVPEIFEIGLEQGLILKEGTCYFIEGEVLSSKPEAERYLAENQEVLDKLVLDLRSQLFDIKS